MTEPIIPGVPFLVPSPSQIERDANRGGGNARQRRRRRRVALRVQWTACVILATMDGTREFTWTDCEVQGADWRRVYYDALKYGKVLPYNDPDPPRIFDPS